ncbi:MAG: enoyl-ACP reductase [Planctomycetota bacterium]
MADMQGKRGLVFGIANDRSIAAAIAKCCHDGGAKMGFTHLPETDPARPKAAKRLGKVVDGWDPAFKLPCDVRFDDQIDAVFAEAEKTLGGLDFVVHSLAFADLADLQVPTYEASREGFKMAMEISAYSLGALAKRAKPLMTDGGSIVAMSYIGGEAVVPGYNMMGLCKSALETSVKYLAHELGPHGIRVNAISAGPLRTLAASAVGEFSKMNQLYETFSPLKRNITAEEVGEAGAFLLSDVSSGITGENLHVDAGYHVMGAPPEEAQEV